MIYDRLQNIKKYLGIHPNMDIALSYIADSLDDMPAEAELKGRDVRAFLNEYTTVPPEEGFFEAHELFADIQIMLSGAEQVEVSNTDRLTVTRAEPENDFWAMEGAAEASVILRPGSFLILPPGDAHKLKLMLGEPQPVVKAVFKVRMRDK